MVQRLTESKVKITQDIMYTPKESANKMSKDEVIVEDKQWRQTLDATLQQMKESTFKSRNRSLSITHLEDSIMRLGMDLKEINAGPAPYPNSYNPKNTIVEPTADGLKL